MKQVVNTILICLTSILVYAQSTHTISGYVVEQNNGEALIGATIIDQNSGQGTITNQYGFFSLTLPDGNVNLSVKYIGFESFNQQINLRENHQLSIALAESVENLDDVVISAERFEIKEEITSTTMGSINLKPKEIAIIPAISGEVDVIKVAQLMPGVSKGGEGATGLFVRGGTDDQNLVLLDEATVYNIGHLFGFFSVFNNGSLRDVNVIKGGFPAQYGGRLSSVIDVRMKEGDLQKWHGEGGIGSISSRATFDGPIIKNKLSMMLSGRRTYIDQLVALAGANLPYYFYDLNAKLTYKISERDRIYASSYFGSDVLAFSGVAEERDEDGDGIADNPDDIGEELNFGFDLGNFTTTLRWNHIYPQDKLFSNVTLFHTRFKYDIRGNFVDNSLLIRSKIRDVGAKANWDYYPNPQNSIKFGVNYVAHFFRPNVVNTSGEISRALENQEGEVINNQEVAFYANNDQTINEKLSLNYGLRLSSAIVQGQFYGGIEPRFSARYALAPLTSVKMSYTFMKQYMHRVSSSSIALPTDLWYPVTKSVKPQHSHQIATGLFHGIEDLGINVSLEVYYKTMQNLIEYREGARLLLNDNFEDELLTGKGHAYGAELLVRKKIGKFTGWIGYSLAKATRQFEELNFGEQYAAKYDRRHDLSLIMNFDINPRLVLSTVWVMATGSRFTAQNAQYFMPNASFTSIDLVPVYTKRNSVELASSHRLDFNFILKNKPEKKFRSEWHFSVYNFYNRASPFQVTVEFDGLNYRYVQTGLFGFIPSIAWNFKF